MLYLEIFRFWEKSFRRKWFNVMDVSTEFKLSMNGEKMGGNGRENGREWEGKWELLSELLK